MSQALSARRCLLLAIAVLSFASCLVARARADSFGELQHFGAAGKGLGSFETAEAHVLGADPTTNTVYVGDAVKEGQFRIQKFVPGTAGEYEKSGKPVNDTEVKIEVEKSLKKILNEPELEGIAVDPANEVLYALVVGERDENLLIDPDEPAAFAVYAITTKTMEAKLLAGPAELNTESEAQGAALLEPTGIAVDPLTHDLVIAGIADIGGESSGSENPRVAVQVVHPNGALGTRYVDTADCFEGEGPAEPCEEATGTPTSPAVTPTGKVYVETPNEIWEIPSTENKTTKELLLGAGSPKLLYRLPSFEAVQALVSTTGGPQSGGGLSFAGEGASGNEGKLWVFARIREATGSEPELRSGALALNWAELVAGKPVISEAGWTGGAPASSTVCKIANSERDVAAGANGSVFEFDATPSAPRVLEFGTSGSGCPHASASALTAHVRAEEVGTKARPIHTSEEATLEVTLTQAYAKRVVWSFGPGETAESHSTEYPTAKITHKFATIGEHEVTATIETDDLATPTITESKKLLVSPSPPNAQFSFPTEQLITEAAKFDASSSSDPNGSSITQYIWNFGDGSSITTTTPTTQHLYGATGAYTVTLEELDAIGQRSAPLGHQVDVVAPAPPSPQSPQSPPTVVTTATAPPPVAQKPSTGGVLSYSVKLARSTLSVSASGSFSIDVSCDGQSSCTGSVALRTLNAVAAKVHKSILTLASGSFSLAGGHAKLLTLHLSSKAKRLLAKSHTLRVRATIVARDASGATHTTQTTVTLKAAKSKKK